jgi:hypothetical protein
MQALKYMVCVLSIVLAAQMATAQAVRLPLIDLDNLFLKLRQDSNMNFTATYYIQDDDSVGVVLYDTLVGTIKLNKTNFYADFGKYKRITNPYFSMILDTVGKEMYVDYPKENVAEVIDLRITDEKYYKAYVDSIYYTNPTLKDEAVFAFNENSPYYYYKIKFNKASNVITSVEYSAKKIIEDYSSAGASTNASTRVKIVFSSYSNTAINKDIFDLSVYFRNLASGIVPTASYSNYTVVNLTQTN